MLKPLTVARQDFIDALTTLVESAELPAFIIVNELQTISEKIKPIIDLQYQADLEKMENESDDKRELKS